MFAILANTRTLPTPKMIIIRLLVLTALGLVSISAVGQPPLSKDAEKLLHSASAGIHNIDTQELSDQLNRYPQTVLVDVRGADEILLRGGRIDAPRSYNIPRGWLEFRIADRALTKDTPIVVYCGVNQRSPLAAATLTQMGYSNVMNYADGFFAWQKQGKPVEAPDLALDSMLFSKPQKVAEGVWSAIGATEPPSYANSGHNNNLSFIVTDDGVVVINAGRNVLLAEALHEEIRQVTDQPVRYLIWENGQGHAALGSAYWKAQGVHIVAHVDAAAEVKRHASKMLDREKTIVRDKLLGTKVLLPDETFVDKKVIELGGKRIEVLHLGSAHSPGDISVWLPEQKLVIAGDIAFHERLLPIFDGTDTGAWLATWDTFAALGAQAVIPGHGGPTNMAEVTKYTKDYLRYMREQITAILDEGGGLNDIYKIDQSAFSHLDTFDELAVLNASRMFRQMEFE